MTELAEQTKGYETDFAALAGTTWNGQPQWVDPLRRAAIERFAAVGLPSTKLEEWRFTNVAPIARTRFDMPATVDPQAAAGLARQFSFGDEAAVELVFVNGVFAPQLSMLLRPPAGVQVASLAEAMHRDAGRIEHHLGRYTTISQSPFVALNTAFLRDGAYIHLSAGTQVQGPIHLLFLSLPGARATMSHPRTLVVVEDGAQAQIVESYVGPSGEGVYLTNPVTEIVAGPDARIDHCKLQQESIQAFHVAAMQVELAANANFVSHSATLGGRLTRNDLRVILNGERADATLNGLVIIGGEQHCDNHTLLKHEKPNCPSHELYKHVLGDRATGIFKGQIYVQQGAIGTDSKQTSKSLLLSDHAMMESMPALEIYADDVKCTHGSTTGPVDEDMVFYLRTRGVGLEAARHLLSYAFAADITRRIKVEPVRRRLEDFMAAQHGLPQDLRITHLGEHDEAAL